MTNLLEEMFPIGSMEMGAELQLCNCRTRDRYHPADALVVHLVVWERPGLTGQEYRSIRDVKEQRVNLPSGLNTQFMAALKVVLTEVLKASDRIETLMPNDLFASAWSALKLKTVFRNAWGAQAGYEKALRVKSRLGKYMAVLRSEPCPDCGAPAMADAYYDGNYPGDDSRRCNRCGTL